MKLKMKIILIQIIAIIVLIGTSISSYQILKGTSTSQQLVNLDNITEGGTSYLYNNQAAGYQIEKIVAPKEIYSDQPFNILISIRNLGSTSHIVNLWFDLIEIGGGSFGGDAGISLERLESIEIKGNESIDISFKTVINDFLFTSKYSQLEYGSNIVSCSLIHNEVPVNKSTHRIDWHITVKSPNEVLYTFLGVNGIIAGSVIALKIYYKKKEGEL